MKTVIRLDNLTFPIDQAEIDGTLSVIGSIAGTAWAYRSQQPATPGSLPLMPAAVPAPPPAASRRLLATRGGRQLQQVVVAAAPSPPLPGGGACLGTSDAVVRDQATCQGACQAQLAGSSSEGVAGAALSPETYAGPGGELCCRCVYARAAAPPPPPFVPPLGPPPPLPGRTWYLPPDLGAAAPADASGVFFFADSVVPVSEVDGIVSSMYASSDDGYLPSQLEAAGVPVSGAAVLYVGVDDPVFSGPAVDQTGTPDSTSSSSTGIIVGVVAGVAAALAVTAALALFVSRKRRKRQQQATRAETRRWRAAGVKGAGKSVGASRAVSALPSTYQTSTAGSEQAPANGANTQSAAFAADVTAGSLAVAPTGLPAAGPELAASSGAGPGDGGEPAPAAAPPALRPGEWEARMRERLGLGR